MNGFDSPGHVGYVNAVAFSRDGRLVASCSWDGTIRVWDAATGGLLKVLDLHDQARCCRQEAEGFAFLPGARLLFSFGSALWIWSPEREEPVRFPDPRAEQVRVFEGGAITYECKGSRIAIWDADVTRVIRVLVFPGVELVRPAVSSCGSFLAFLREHQRVAVIDLRNGSALGEITVPRCWHEADLAFSPSGSHLGYAGGDEAPIVVDTATGRLVASLGGPKHTSLGFGKWYHGLVRFAGASRVATAGEDGRVRLWSLPDGREEASLVAPNVRSRQRINPRIGELEIGPAAHSAWIRDIAFAPGGDVLASAGDDHVVRLWNVRTGELLRVLGEPRNTILALAARGDRIASSHEDGRVRIWDVRRRKVVGEKAAHASRVTGLAFPAADSLVSCSKEGTLRLWRLPLLEGMGAFSGDHASIEALALSPDGRVAAIGGSREVGGSDTKRIGHVVLRSLATGESGPAVDDWGEVPTETCGGWWKVNAMAMHPSGRLLATAIGWQVRLWDTATGLPAGALVTKPHFMHGVHSLAFSPDGRRLAAGTLSGSVYLWDLENLALVLEFGAARDSIGDIAFTPDGGSLVLVTDYDNAVWIHDASTGKLHETLHAHRASLRALAVSGNLLATGGQDGSIQLWSIGCWKNLGSLWHPSSAKPERDPA